MKTAGAVTMFGLMISFLLVAGEKEAVLDTKGKPVMANARYAQYYIRFKIPGEEPKERAYISNYGNIDYPWKCLQTVVALSAGAPSAHLKIPPPIQFESSSDVIRVGTELNIRFTLFSQCFDQTGYWRVPSSSVIKEIVLTGSNYWGDSVFTIQKSSENGFYKLAFGSADKPTDIGLQKVHDYVANLILSKEGGFLVSFERVV